MARLSQNLNDALNQQILNEYHNMLIYRQIQSYFEDFQLKNLAEYFSKQAEDENGHAQKFMSHIISLLLLNVINSSIQQVNDP